MQLYFYEMSIGRIGICEDKGSITRLYFADDARPQDIPIGETPALREAASQIRGYLLGEITEFTVPLAPEGTAFMKQVWQELCRIPYGKTATYRDVGVAVGRLRAARAVGLANNRNPIPIFIPCHRVIGSNGSLTGYRGGLDLKQRLLTLEADGVR